MNNTTDQRQSNREKMPNVAKVVDQFTKAFGPVKVIAAEDYVTGVKVGTFPQEISNEEKTFSR